MAAACHIGLGMDSVYWAGGVAHGTWIKETRDEEPFHSGQSPIAFADAAKPSSAARVRPARGPKRVPGPPSGGRPFPPDAAVVGFRIRYRLVFDVGIENRVEVIILDTIAVA